jgi:hypothetical protein
LSGAGLPGDISTAAGTKVDADLSVAQQEALLGAAEMTLRAHLRKLIEEGMVADREGVYALT